MNEKEIEGKTYILKSDVENIIKQRLEKVASRANQAEQRADQLQSELEKAGKSTATIDLLTQQLDEMQNKLSKSEKKFTRYQAISKHGLTDPTIVDAIEIFFEKSQEAKPKKERSSLGEWLDQIVENPDNAPTILRPHIQSLQPAEAQPATEMSYEEAQGLSAELAQNTPRPPAPQAPQTNTGVHTPPEAGDIIARGAQDKRFYENNRQSIMDAWRSQRKRRG